MLVNELIALLEKEDPNKEVHVELNCDLGCCHDHVDAEMDSTSHDYILIK
jgi:hypothetical protein